MFIDLPPLYTDLYNMVKFPYGRKGVSLEDPAICLSCGQILNGGNRRREGGESESNPGECSLHARSCGAGVSCFFLVQQCYVLLLRDSRACYYPSLYHDASGGEVKQNKTQNKPLFLSKKRYAGLEELYLSHQVPREVVRKRASAERVVRQFWY